MANVGLSTMRRGGVAVALGLLLLPISAWSQAANACDVNKDGTANVIDAQIVANNWSSCGQTAALSTFWSKVITGVLSSCPVTTGIHTVSLSWTASSTGGATYNVYRAATSGGYGASAPLNASTPISGTSFTDCNVVLGQPYYYVVTAVASGNESAKSPEVAVTIPST